MRNILGLSFNVKRILKVHLSKCRNDFVIKRATIELSQNC